MRVYFLAEKPCALNVNGIYLGIVDGFERSVELKPEDKLFCELKPFGALPVRFCFDEEFLLSPPPQIKLYYTKTGVAVYGFRFLSDDQTLKVIWQQRLGGDLLTLCTQGAPQLNLENETGFHLIPLPEGFLDCKAALHAEGYLLESKSHFALIARDGKIIVLSEGKVLEREGALKAEIPFHDSLAHTAVCTWEHGELTACAVRTAHEATEATYALALFESALVGADCKPYLHENLQDKAGSLKEFLGDFCSVVLTQERDEVGLVFERKERVYDVKYFRVTVTDGKIDNIIPN